MENETGSVIPLLTANTATENVEQEQLPPAFFMLPHPNFQRYVVYNTYLLFASKKRGSV